MGEGRGDRDVFSGSTYSSQIVWEHHRTSGEHCTNTYSDVGVTSSRGKEMGVRGSRLLICSPGYYRFAI